jgi:hypothetical protein
LGFNKGILILEMHGTNIKNIGLGMITVSLIGGKEIINKSGV